MVRPYLFYFFRVDRSWFSKMTMLVRKFLHGGKIKYTVGWLFISKNVAALLMIFLLIFFASPKKNQKKSPANNNTSRQWRDRRSYVDHLYYCDLYTGNSTL